MIHDHGYFCISCGDLYYTPLTLLRLLHYDDVHTPLVTTQLGKQQEANKYLFY